MHRLASSVPLGSLAIPEMLEIVFSLWAQNKHQNLQGAPTQVLESAVPSTAKTQIASDSHGSQGISTENYLAKKYYKCPGLPDIMTAAK